MSGSRLSILDPADGSLVGELELATRSEVGNAVCSSGRCGLAAVVLTGSMEHAQRAWRDLPVGTVNAALGEAPGGAALARGGSGQGFGYGPELLDEVTATKVVHLGLPTI